MMLRFNSCVVLAVMMARFSLPSLAHAQVEPVKIELTPVVVKGTILDIQRQVIRVQTEGGEVSLSYDPVRLLPNGMVLTNYPNTTLIVRGTKPPSVLKKGMIVQFQADVKRRKAILEPVDDFLVLAPKVGLRGGFTPASRSRKKPAKIVEPTEGVDTTDIDTGSVTDDPVTDDPLMDDPVMDDSAMDDSAIDDTVTSEGATERTLKDEMPTDDTAKDDTAKDDTAKDDTASDDTASDDGVVDNVDVVEVSDDAAETDEEEFEEEDYLAYEKDTEFFTITGTVESYRPGRALVEIPDGRIMRHIAVPISPTAVVRLEMTNLALVKAGDNITATGDIVRAPLIFAKSLDITLADPYLPPAAAMAEGDAVAADTETDSGEEMETSKIADADSEKNIVTPIGLVGDENSGDIEAMSDIERGESDAANLPESYYQGKVVQIN